MSYARVEKDILRQLKQDPGSYCTTMVDYYGLGKGFPGTPVPTHLDNIRKVEHVEHAVKDDICRKIPEFRPDVRLIPYISMHEYEALLFSDPDAFAQAIGQPRLARSFQLVLNDFATPEDINCGVESHPSKRVTDIHAGYKKVIEGTQAARAVGVQKMREKCVHFGAWLQQLEALPEL